VEAMPLDKADVTNQSRSPKCDGRFLPNGLRRFESDRWRCENWLGIAAGPAASNQDRKAVFQTREPVGFENGTQFYVHIVSKTGERTYARTFSTFRDDECESQSRPSSYACSCRPFETTAGSHAGRETACVCILPNG